jgi:hypothetical protein
LQNKIKQLLLNGKTDKEIISELSQGINLSPEDGKIIWQHPPKTVKPTSHYNKHSGRKNWREKGKFGKGRDRQQTREFQEQEE